MNLRERNRLIADFVHESPDNNYQDSWELLMSALFYISNETGYELVMRWDYCYWNMYGENPLGVELPGYCNGREAVFHAIVEFLIWYN